MKKFMYTHIVCILIIIISGCGMLACIDFLSQKMDMNFDNSLQNEYYASVSFIDAWFGDIGVMKKACDNKEAIIFFFNNIDSFSALQDAIFANTIPLHITNSNETFMTQNSESILNFDKITLYMDLLHIKSISYLVEPVNKELETGDQHATLYLSVKLQNGADECLVYSETASIIDEEYIGWWELGGNWFYPDKPQHIGPDCLVPY